MNSKIKIAVFASGSGSNFAVIEEACRKGELNAEIVLMVTNKPEAFVVERAEKGSIPVAAFRPKDFETKDAYEEAILTCTSRIGGRVAYPCRVYASCGSSTIDGLSISHR